MIGFLDYEYIYVIICAGVFILADPVFTIRYPLAEF